jgi:hypothetical protein
MGVKWTKILVKAAVASCIGLIAVSQRAPVLFVAASAELRPGSKQPRVFTEAELATGFLDLAFGADVQTGSGGDRIVRFANPMRVYVPESMPNDTGRAIYLGVFQEFQRVVPQLDTRISETNGDANVRIHLIRQIDLAAMLETRLGANTARQFMNQTTPQCTTRVQSTTSGAILRADVFIIRDKGKAALLDCAYHETLHAFGLLNHANDNPWTTLNQNRQVGYLTTYDRALLAILYDARIQPGMGKIQVEHVLPSIVHDVYRKLFN